MNRPHYAHVTHIEGMDLAGKSTATAHIVARTGGTLQRNSLVPDNPTYIEADQLRREEATPDVLGPLYVDALAWDLDNVVPGGRRVQDSTILLRSLAFYEVLGYDDTVRQLRKMVPQHPLFGLTIVLTASLEARVLRLAERQRLAPEEIAPDDLMVINEPDLFLDMERVLITNAVNYFNAVTVDNSLMTKAESQAAVGKLLAATETGLKA